MRKIIKKLIMMLKKFFDVRDTGLTEQELKELEEWIKNR